MPIVLYVNMYCTSKKRDIIGVFKIIQEKNTIDLFLYQKIFTSSKRAFNLKSESDCFIKSSLYIAISSRYSFWIRIIGLDSIIINTVCHICPHKNPVDLYRKKSQKILFLKS